MVLSFNKVFKALMTYSKILALEADREMERSGSFHLEVVVLKISLTTILTMMMILGMTFLEGLNLVVLETLSLNMIMSQIFTSPEIERTFTMMIMEIDFIAMFNMQNFNNQVEVGHVGL